MVPSRNLPTPQTELEKKFEAQARMAAYRKEIAAAQEAEAKANKQRAETRTAEQSAAREAWKAPELKGLEGKVTATGAFVETQVLATACLKELTDALVQKMMIDSTLKEAKQLVIYPAEELPSMEHFQAVLEQLVALEAILGAAISGGSKALRATPSLDALGGSAGLTAGFAAAGILSTAANIFSFFKGDLTITNHDIAVEESLLVSQFQCSSKEATAGWKIYYPSAYPVLMLTGASYPSELQQVFNRVKTAYAAARNLQEELERKLTDLDATLLLEVDEAKKQHLQHQKERLTETLVPLQSGTAVFVQLELLLLAVDPASKQSVWTLVLRAEKLVALLKQPGTYMIQLKMKLNGSTQVKQTPFWFTKVLHSGGTQLTCLVFATDGSVQFSHQGYFYKPYGEVKEMKSL